MGYVRGNTGGFTLLEIIVVVIILGVLAAIVAPRFVGTADDANVTAARVQIKNLQTALKMFKVDNGFYPGTDQGLESLVNRPSGGRDARNYRQGGYLDSNHVPLDPWGNPFVYVSPGVNGEYDIISLGADGVEGGDGVDADINSWDQ